MNKSEDWNFSFLVYRCFNYLTLEGYTVVIFRNIFFGYGKKKGYSAFTLVELLVVISIIAMLLAILIPALSNARNQAKAAVCKTNLKTIGLAEMLYMTQNDGRLALSRGDRPTNSGFYWAAQLWALFQGVPLPKSSDYYTSRSIEHPSWLTCPSQNKTSSVHDNTYSGIRYAWNDVYFNAMVKGVHAYWLKNICYSRNGSDQGYYQPSANCNIPAARLINFKNPSNAVANADGWDLYFYGEGEMRDYTDLYLADGVSLRGRYRGKGTYGLQVEYRHGNGHSLNVLLWDGHVNSVKNSIADTYRLDPIPGQNNRPCGD